MAVSKMEVIMNYADLLKELIEENKKLILENQSLKRNMKKSPCCEQDDLNK